MSRAWVQQQERGSSFTVRLIIWIALHVGRAPARLLLHPITLYFLFLAPRQRRASRAFLARALGRPATLVDAARHVHTFASTILDRVFLLADRTGCFRLDVQGAEHVLEQMRGGRGCLLLGSHLGSFEVLRVLAVSERGFPLKVLMYADHHQMMQRMLNQLNPAIADTVIPLGRPDALLRVNESLAKGELVGLLGDRVFQSDKTVRCRFLGKETTFPAGPALLSAMLNAPTILCFGLYRGNGHYEVVFEKMDPPPRSRDEATLRDWTQRYVDRLEYHARRAPYNWFNFYDYWHDQEGESDRAPAH